MPKKKKNKKPKFEIDEDLKEYAIPQLEEDLKLNVTQIEQLQIKRNYIQMDRDMVEKFFLNTRAEREEVDRKVVNEEAKAQQLEQHDEPPNRQLEHEQQAQAQAPEHARGHAQTQARQGGGGAADAQGSPVGPPIRGEEATFAPARATEPTAESVQEEWGAGFKGNPHGLSAVDLWDAASVDDRGVIVHHFGMLQPTFEQAVEVLARHGRVVTVGPVVMVISISTLTLVRFH